jgi:hypothetical protein
MALYGRADEACGGARCDARRVIVLSPYGEFREQECMADESAVDAALAYWRVLAPIERACESANRAERKAREAVSA